MAIQGNVGNVIQLDANCWGLSLANLPLPEIPELGSVPWAGKAPTNCFDFGSFPGSLEARRVHLTSRPESPSAHGIEANIPQEVGGPVPCTQVRNKSTCTRFHGKTQYALFTVLGLCPTPKRVPSNMSPGLERKASGGFGDTLAHATIQESHRSQRVQPHRGCLQLSGHYVFCCET